MPVQYSRHTRFILACGIAGVNPDERAVVLFSQNLRLRKPRPFMTLLANESTSAIRKPGHPQGDAPTIDECACQATGYGRGDRKGSLGIGRCHARFNHLRHSPTESFMAGRKQAFLIWGRGARRLAPLAEEPFCEGRLPTHTGQGFPLVVMGASTSLWNGLTYNTLA
jgi:hypothetical protein